MDADEPLANPRHETYCHERIASRTQRQAKLAAWPERSRWKPETVDNKICKLEAEQEDKARIAKRKELYQYAKQNELTRICSLLKE